jgi:bifunctional enzyme CysN/CysC
VSGPGITVWLTGLPAAGKTTLAATVATRLAADGRRAHVLDGDELRRGLSSDLDLSRAGRAENVRRAGAVAVLLAGQGAIAIAGLVSPYRADRDAVRLAHEQARIAFAEVWVATAVEECARRDAKGLYRRAAAGELTGLTGWDAPYEEPLQPDAVILPTPHDDGVEAVLRLIRERSE